MIPYSNSSNPIFTCFFAERNLQAFALFDELEEVAVQPFRVYGVERILHDLQPIARDDRAAENPDRALGDESVELAVRAAPAAAEIPP